MIGRCSLDSKRRGHDRHPTNVCFHFFRYTSDDQINHLKQWLQSRKSTWEDNKYTFNCYFKTNRIKRGFRKRKIKIWVELGRFKTRNQIHAEQVKTIIKVVLYLKYWKSTNKYIGKHINRAPNTVTETLNTEKLETSNQKQTLTNREVPVV